LREHRKDMIAILEITRSADGRRIFQDDPHVIDAVRALQHLLSGFQTVGQLRPDFDPYVIAIAIRAAIDAVPSRLALDPEFDIDNYSRDPAVYLHERSVVLVSPQPGGQPAPRPRLGAPSLARDQIPGKLALGGKR
jgi:hypothetical protein